MKIEELILLIAPGKVGVFSTTGRLKKKSCFLWLDRDLNRFEGKTVNREANGTKGTHFKEVRDNDPVNNCQDNVVPQAQR